jgi:hypothetical protein
MDDEKANVQVKCRSCSRGEERPISIILDGQEHQITSINREWIEEAVSAPSSTPDGRTTSRIRKRFFSIRLVSGQSLVISHDLLDEEWRLEKVG